MKSDLTRDDFDVRPVASGLLPVDQPCWVRRDAPVGSMLMFEQRYWIAELQLDGRRVRAKEGMASCARS